MSTVEIEAELKEITFTWCRLGFEEGDISVTATKLPLVRGATLGTKFKVTFERLE